MTGMPENIINETIDKNIVTLKGLLSAETLAERFDVSLQRVLNLWTANNATDQMDRPKVRCWEGRTPPPEYYRTPDPNMYKQQPVFNYFAMAQYARETGRKIVDLSYEEVEQFCVK